MTKKLEELFNLQTEDDDEPELDVTVEHFDSTGYDLTELQTIYEEVDKIDKALGVVKNLDELDKELDKYSERAMEVFNKLVEIGENVEDRNIAPVYDAASKMMANAITASQSKMDRKLKAIHLQIQKSKVDLEAAKLAFKQEERRARGEDSKPIDAEVNKLEISRADLILEITKQINQPKCDK